MSGDAEPILPQPQDGDPEDVVWALQTADALWKRGEYGDALSWIRRAINAAADADADMRVIQLAKATAELTALVEAFAPPPPPPAPPAADTSGIDIDVDIATESPAPSPADLAPKRPPGPPPRPKAPPPRPRLPTPNPVPSPLRELPFDEIASAAMMEETSESPPIPEPIPPSHDGDSLKQMPSVPPAPPDFAPTPMAMPVAKSFPPPYEPPPPKVAIAPDSSPRTARTSTAPFGSPDPAGTRAAPPPSSRQVDDEVVTSAPRMAPPRPSANRLGTPPMGSVPPPRVSMKPSAVPVALEDGVQSHVSDAPPRTAQAASVHIPPAPRAPSVDSLPSPMPALASAPPSNRVVILDPEEFEALGDVPDDAREALARASEKVVLLPDETAPAPPMVIVLQGELEVRATGFSSRLDFLSAGQVRLLVPFAPAEGELRVVGGPKGARYLSLPVQAIEDLRTAAPWVVQELEPISDDVHVVAGCLRGRLGPRLDGSVLDAILRRAKTMRLAPNAKVVKQGEPVRALILVGAGELAIRAEGDDDAPVLETLDPGDVVFASELLARQPAPATVRAGERGALVIVATRSATEELLVTVPPLLEMLGEA